MYRNPALTGSNKIEPPFLPEDCSEGDWPQEDHMRNVAPITCYLGTCICSNTNSTLYAVSPSLIQRILNQATTCSQVDVNGGLDAGILQLVLGSYADEVREKSHQSTSDVQLRTKYVHWYWRNNCYLQVLD